MKATLSFAARGSVLVEFVIGLPVFLALIFFVLWFSFTMNAKSSLGNAVSDAVRLAASRSNAWIPGAPPIAYIDDVTQWNGDLRIYFASPPDATAGPDTHDFPDFYNSPGDALAGRYAGNVVQMFGRTLDQMPDLYKYSLVYATQLLKQSLGSNLRMPCNPDDADHGAGCVACYFLNPDNWRFTQESSDAIESWYAANPDSPVPVDRIGLECRYRQPSFLIGPLLRLFSVMAGMEEVDANDERRYIVTRRAIFYVPEVMLGAD